MSQLRLWVGPDTLPGRQGNAVSRRLIAGGPTGSRRRPTIPPVQLVGDDQPVPCVDGEERPYLSLDAAASTNALPAVADRATCSCRGIRACTGAPGTSPGRRRRLRGGAGSGPDLRRAPADGEDVAIICRNTTEAINHLAYRLRLEPEDVVATTVVEHHANLLPWARMCRRRFVECDPDGTFALDAISDALRRGPVPDCWRSPAHPTCRAGRRRSRRSSTRPTSAACRSWSTPPSWPPTGPCPRPPTSWRGAGTRCTPRSGRGS